MDESPEQLKPGQMFFVVSPFKLAVLSVLSFGFYEIWWIFKNWLYIEKAGIKVISPYWRTLFALFFNYSLFKQIRGYGQDNGFNKTLAVGLLFPAWVLLGFSGYLPAPLCLIRLCDFVPLVIVQNYINELNWKLNPSCEINGKFTTGNWVIVVVGGGWMIRVLFGYFLPHNFG